MLQAHDLMYEKLSQEFQDRLHVNVASTHGPWKHEKQIWKTTIITVFPTHLHYNCSKNNIQIHTPSCKLIWG